MWEAKFYKENTKIQRKDDKELLSKGQFSIYLYREERKLHERRSRRETEISKTKRTHIV